MAHAKNHDYHILNPSVWPFIGAIGGFVMLFGAVLWMKEVTAADIPLYPWVFIFGLLMVCYVMYGWWAEVVEESQRRPHACGADRPALRRYPSSSCPR